MLGDSFKNNSEAVVRKNSNAIFAFTCTITNGQSVESFIGQLQEQCPKILGIKNGNLQIFDEFPTDINFDCKTTDNNINKYHYHDDDNKYIFFKKCSDNMSLDSSEKSSPVKHNSFLKKMTKKKIIIIDGDEELSFYHFDYPVEIVKGRI